jgi:hypothetical protein
VKPHVVEVQIEQPRRPGHDAPAQQHQGDRRQRESPVQRHTQQERALDGVIDEQLLTFETRLSGLNHHDASL